MSVITGQMPPGRFGNNRLSNIMKLSDYVIEFLIANDIDHIFEVCGGAVTHLLDSLYGRQDIKVVSMHHEQAASFAAEAYSRTTGKLGVAMATSGPGATNLITGIGSCYFDSIPALFITGQVNTYEFKFYRPVRQVGFQETDIVNIIKPITKYSVIVSSPDSIRYHLEKAAFLALSGRPGPVLVDIPMDVQRANINISKLKGFMRPALYKKPNGADIARAAKLIKSAQRPVILAGGGIRLAGAQDRLSKLTENSGIPVVTSLLGKDSFPNKGAGYMGMIGTYGNRCANLAVANADLVLALGTRLDTRQTGTLPATFAREAVIIHVDVDRHELNHKRKADLAINCDAGIFLELLNKQIKDFDKNRLNKWREVLAVYKKGLFEKHRTRDRIEPSNFFDKLSKYLPDKAIISADIGQNQMWAAQSLEVSGKQRFLTQGGMGAMGSSLAFGIGAAFADSGVLQIVITGDGGFQLNIQELQTVVEYNLPIKIIMLNNQCYGMVRQFQAQYFNSRLQSTVIGYSAPDFQKVVSAYGIKTEKISDPLEIDPVLKRMFGDHKALFLEVEINGESEVLPKLSINRPIEEQEPLLKRAKLLSYMIVKPWAGKNDV